MVARSSKPTVMSRGLAQGEGFLNSITYKMRYIRTVLVNEYELGAKSKTLFVQAINVVVEGFLLWIALGQRNSDNVFLRILSYGLIAALLSYYFSYIVEKVGKEWKSK